MKDSNRRNYEALKRDDQFATDYPPAVGSAIASIFTDLHAKVDEIESKAGTQMLKKGEYAEGFDLKEISAEDLTEKLIELSDAANAAERQHPGIQAVFHFRRNLSLVDRLATARAFITAGNTWEDVMKEFSNDPTWIANLTALADAFEASLGQADSGIEGRAASVAEINQAVSEGMQIKRDLDKLVPIFYKNNPGALAAWAVATRVESAPKKKP